jgi:hypothetical protein
MKSIKVSDIEEDWKMVWRVNMEDDVYKDIFGGSPLPGT